MSCVQANVGFRFSQVEDWTDGSQDIDLGLGASSRQGGEMVRGRGDGGGDKGSGYLPLSECISSLS